MELTLPAPPTITSSAAGSARPSSTTALVQATDVSRRWGKGATAQLGVDRVDLTIGSGEFVAVVGPSGSGKSTLGALLVGIDRPTSGSLVVAGVRIDRLSDDRLARWRGSNVGIVFQNSHLLPTLDARENVELALKLADGSTSRRSRRDRSRAALRAVGLEAKAKRLPTQLSGGEQQRVAVARAIVSEPNLVVADEPTGSLDQESGALVFDLLAGLVAGGTTVVVITHDEHLAARADRVANMLDGRIISLAGLAPTNQTGVR